MAMAHVSHLSRVDMLDLAYRIKHAGASVLEQIACWSWDDGAYLLELACRSLCAGANALKQLERWGCYARACLLELVC